MNDEILLMNMDKIIHMNMNYAMLTLNVDGVIKYWSMSSNIMSMWKENINKNILLTPQGYVKIYEGYVEGYEPPNSPCSCSFTH
jgi:hypothetical protein